MSVEKMRDNQKTKSELLKEAKSLRKRVTELRQIEQMLLESVDKNRSLVTNIPDVIWTTDSNGKTTFISPSVEKVYGYKPEEIYEQGDRLWFGRIHPDDVIEVKEAYQVFCEKGMPFDIEYRIKRKDGKWIWLHDRSIVTYEKDGVIYADGMFSDITEHKEKQEKLKDSEERFRILFQSAAEGILVADIETMDFKYANSAICKMLGYTEEELIQLNVCDIHPKEDLEYVISEFKFQARGIKISSPRIPCLRKDGTIIYADVHTTSIFLDGRECNVGFFTDVTKRKQAEDRLRESEEKWRSLGETAPAFIMTVSYDGTILFLNRPTGGLTVEQAIGTKVYSYVKQEQSDMMRKHIEEVFRTGKPGTYKILGLGPKGPNSAWYETHLGPIISDGKIIAVTMVSLDITERRRIEEDLEKSEENYRILVENQSDMVVKFDPNGVLLFVSPSYCETFGRTQDELIGKKFIPLIHKQDRERVAELLNNVYEPPYMAYVEERALTKDGWRWQAWQNTAVLNNEKKVEAVIGVGRDITKRKEAEEEVEKFKEMAERSPFGCAMAALNGNFTYINKAFAEMHGYTPSELIGKNLKIFHTDRQMKHVERLNKQLVETGEGFNAEEVWHVHRDGTEFLTLMSTWVLKEPDGNPHLMCGTALDVTEYKKAEEELKEYREKIFHAEKLASLGALSASLAHGLNSPLTAVRLSIENSLSNLEKMSSLVAIKEELEVALTGILHADSIVKGFSDFAKKSSRHIVSRVNLKAVAEKIVKLLSGVAQRARVSLHIEDMDKLPTLYSNDRDLEQIFFALTENAIQAADGKKDHLVVINGDVKDGYVELQFADDCGGIEKRNLDKVFEPFFTTKAVDEGSGLGLSIVKRIVSEAGGKVRVESITGKGSTFFVTIPIKGDWLSLLNSNEQ